MKHDLDYMISVMQAANEGKEIECSQIVSMFENWIPVENPLWDWASYHYRVKPEVPEPGYVPYENAKEFLQGNKEHGPYIINTSSGDLYYKMADLVVDEGIRFDDKLITYDEVLLKLSWADGSPCGKLKE